jgi:hypothetical protein
MQSTRPELGTAKAAQKRISGSGEGGSASWFLGTVLVLLVVAGVEVNPSPLMQQDKTDQILKQVRN